MIGVRDNGWVKSSDCIRFKMKCCYFYRRLCLRDEFAIFFKFDFLKCTDSCSKYMQNYCRNYYYGQTVREQIENAKSRLQLLYRGESVALGQFSISIFFGQVDNKESKNNDSNIALLLFGSIVIFLVWFLK